MALFVHKRRFLRRRTWPPTRSSLFWRLEPRRKVEAKKLPYSHPKMVEYSKLVADYREGLLREPLELICYIVRNDRPFTEIVTADYTMVSPYTSRGYGVFEELKEQFQNPEDPYEFIAARIPALQSRNGRQKQESKSGLYPHSGLLSSFQYLKRYPTTETNCTNCACVR